MIFFCEINKTGEEHVMVNSCLLNMLAKGYPSEVIKVWIDKTHFANYQVQANNLKLVYKKVLQPLKSNKLRWIYKIVSEIFMINRIVFSAIISKAKIVFFSSLSPGANYYMSLILPLISKRIKFIITVHGEVELLRTNNNAKKINNIYSNLLRRSFKRSIKNRRFLILSSEIYNNVLKYGFLKPDEMICIEHPYIFPDMMEQADSPKVDRPIVFGHLGVAKLAKQSHLLFKLADAMKEYVIKGLVRFVVVGQVFDELKPFINQYVSFQETNDFLSREDYDHQASALDYSLFFFNEQSYSLTSSGSIMDAIAYEKPIIALKTNFLQNIFDKNACAPGYLYTDFDAMASGMKKIIEEHQSNYENMVHCIKLKKDLFSMDTLFPSFKAQIDQFVIS